MFPIGSYVRVVKVPEPWEGSGEDDEDRQQLVGHIGVVVKSGQGRDDYIGDKNDPILIRFPTTQLVEFFQRCIEPECLMLVANTPKPFTENQLRQM